MSDIDDGFDNINEALDRLKDDVADHIASALDHIRVARKTVADCIDAATSVYVDDVGPAGQAFHNFAQQLLDAEKDLSRAEGELAE